MPNWMLQGLMRNLVTWIEIEENTILQDHYIDLYTSLKKQLYHV